MIPRLRRTTHLAQHAFKLAALQQHPQGLGDAPGGLEHHHQPCFGGRGNCGAWAQPPQRLISSSLTPERVRKSLFALCLAESIRLCKI